MKKGASKYSFIVQFKILLFMIKNTDLRKQELAESLGLQFDEVKDLFSVETLESMDMTQVFGGLAGLDGKCGFVECVHRQCTHGDCTQGTCVDGKCSDVVSPKPSSKPSLTPTLPPTNIM